MQLIDGYVVFSDAWFVELRLLVLGGLLVVAAIGDVRRHRIPNILVLSGVCAAFVFHLVDPVEVGWLRALYGVALAFVMLLPFYLLRGMAAGDVKLMMMVGAFLGPATTFWAVIMTFLVGGAWALALVVGKRSWPQLLGNFKMLAYPLAARSIAVDPRDEVLPHRSVGNLPYGVAIAVGTLLSLIFMKRGVLMF